MIKININNENFYPSIIENKIICFKNATKFYT